MRAFLLLLTLWACSAMAYAWQVVVVQSDRNPVYAETAAWLVDELQRQGMPKGSVGTVTLSDWQQDKAAFASARAWVAVGGGALSNLLAVQARPPVVATLVPRVAYERTVREAGVRSGVTAVYLDQPMARVVQTARAAYPDFKRIGVLWGNESVLFSSSFNQSAQEYGLTVRAASVPNSAQIFVGLQTVLTDAQLLVALADPVVFNANTVSNVLLTSYKAGVPVLAFSPAYVRAGALLALYTTPKQLVPQTVTQVMAVLGSGQVPAVQYPTDFTVEVNDYVAKSMGFTGSGAAITERVKRMEGVRP